jgi:hypothetical protein
MSQWREVVGYAGKYQVSDTGAVWSQSTHKFLEPLTIHGHTYVRLYCGKRQRNTPVARIVAEAFIPNPENFPWVNHIDGDVHNNNMSNLMWKNPN